MKTLEYKKYSEYLYSPSQHGETDLTLMTSKAQNHVTLIKTSTAAGRNGAASENLICFVEF
jgi:hypothetical protein